MNKYNCNQQKPHCQTLYNKYILLDNNVGPTGPTGPAGQTPTFEIGNVLTGPPGSSAEVTMRKI